MIKKCLMVFMTIQFLLMSASFAGVNRPVVPMKESDKTLKAADWYDVHWYEYNLIKGLLYLNKYVTRMVHNNLFSTPEDFRAKNVCTVEAREARTADGSCNSFVLPRMGSKGTYFTRNMPVDTGRINDNSEPNPRTVSEKLILRNDFKEAKYFSFLGASFFQFVIHDWFAHEANNDELGALDLETNDPLRVKHNQRFMVYYKDRIAESDSNNVNYVKNRATHWFDASQLYGSDVETQKRLRSFSNGQLKIKDNYLPVDSDGQEISGNNDNWWIGLSVWHTLFSKEHNAIAAQLKAQNPTWNDQQLFNKARLINTALITKVFLTEMGAPRFQNQIVKYELLSNWYGLANALIGYKKNGIEAKFAPGWEKLLPLPLLKGFVGGKNSIEGIPFAMSEEWALVYRYHQILPDNFKITDNNGNVIQSIPLQNTRGKEAIELAQKFGFGKIIDTMGKQHAGKVVLHNKPRFLSELEVPLLGRIDLGALDILRERERGIPKFNQFRRYLGMKPYTSFYDLTQDNAEAAQLAAVYKTIEDVDSTIGLVAEHKVDGFELGETQSLILSLAAVRRIQSDRFYTTDFNAKTYTRMGIEWINHTTIKDILLRHHPELRSELVNVSNPFAVWDPKLQKELESMNLYVVPEKNDGK